MAGGRTLSQQSSRTMDPRRTGVPRSRGYTSHERRQRCRVHRDVGRRMYRCRTISCRSNATSFVKIIFLFKLYIHQGIKQTYRGERPKPNLLDVDRPRDDEGSRTSVEGHDTSFPSSIRMEPKLCSVRTSSDIPTSSTGKQVVVNSQMTHGP